MAKISNLNNFATKNPVTFIFSEKEDVYNINICWKNCFFNVCGFEVI